MCLAQGPQRSDAGEARTRGPPVSSQALYHCTPRGQSSVYSMLQSNMFNLCKLKHFPGSKLFDTMMVFLKDFSKKLDFEKKKKNQQLTNKQGKEKMVLFVNITVIS